MRRVLGILAIACVLALVACGGGDGDGDDESDGAADAPTATVRSGATAASGSTATTGSTGGSASDAGAPTQESSDFPDVRQPLAPGSSGEVRSSDIDLMGADEEMGTIRVTIVEIMDPATGSGFFATPEAGNRYWAMTVTMEATGDKNVNTGIWYLQAADGTQYEQVFVTGVGEDLPYGSVKPGEPRTGVIVFLIAEDADVQWVLMDPSIYVGGNLVFVAE